ncbi:MAG: hypothetical protein HYX63_23380 [Gammaproteobacteria bacterium]|nr:hypothetical protein [Gammaproteobacteria bacterium]
MKPNRIIFPALACTLALSHTFGEDAHSMTGCLAKGAHEGTFVLNNVEGPVSTVVLAQSTVDLGMHVGHKVEITGTTIAGADPKVHTMQVTGMKHLTASCP